MATHVLAVGHLSIRVPQSWTLGNQVRIQEVGVTSGTAAYLMPTTLPSSGEGITANPDNKSPFFSEQFDTAGGQASLQWDELTGHADYYTLDVMVPASQSSEVKAAMQSIQAPPPATVTQDVNLIQTSQSDHMLSYSSARAGADRWVLIGGNPATAQEEFALYRSTDGGKNWTLPIYTTFRGHNVFLGSAGLANIKFWNVDDGIIAESSGFAQSIVIAYTTDGGNTWKAAHVPKVGEPTGANPPVIVRQTNGSLDVTTTVLPKNQRVTVQSTDDGETWSVVGN